MAIGDRIRIVTEEKYRIMTPPRRPRGEKPATTIRFLRRQIANMEIRINTLHDAIEDRDKVIAGYDAQLSEAQDTAHRISQSAIARRERMAAELAAARADATRLAFLEGYYAKSKETTIQPISAKGAPFPSHQSHTYGRTSAGDSEGLSVRRQDQEGAGIHHRQAGADAGSSDEVRSQPAHDQTHPLRDQVEHVEITEDRGDRFRFFATRN